MEQSKRQLRKAARGGIGLSRPNRRAANRLAIAIAGFEGACKAAGRGGAAAYTKPGAHNCW